MSENPQKPGVLHYAPGAHPHDHTGIWKGSLCMCCGAMTDVCAAWFAVLAVLSFNGVGQMELEGTPFDRLVKFGWLLLIAISAVVVSYMLFSHARKCFKHSHHH